MEFAGGSDSNSSYLQECKNHLYSAYDGTQKSIQMAASFVASHPDMKRTFAQIWKTCLERCFMDTSVSQALSLIYVSNELLQVYGNNPEWHHLFAELLPQYLPRLYSICISIGENIIAAKVMNLPKIVWRSRMVFSDPFCEKLVNDCLFGFNGVHAPQPCGEYVAQSSVTTPMSNVHCPTQSENLNMFSGGASNGHQIHIGDHEMFRVKWVGLFPVSLHSVDFHSIENNLPQQPQNFEISKAIQTIIKQSGEHMSSTVVSKEVVLRTLANIGQKAADTCHNSLQEMARFMHDKARKDSEQRLLLALSGVQALQTVAVQNAETEKNLMIAIQNIQNLFQMRWTDDLAAWNLAIDQFGWVSTPFISVYIPLLENLAERLLTDNSERIEPSPVNNGSSSSSFQQPGSLTDDLLLSIFAQFVEHQSSNALPASDGLTSYPFPSLQTQSPLALPAASHVAAPSNPPAVPSVPPTDPRVLFTSSSGPLQQTHSGDKEKNWSPPTDPRLALRRPKIGEAKLEDHGGKSPPLSEREEQEEGSRRDLEQEEKRNEKNEAGQAEGEEHKGSNGNISKMDAPSRSGDEEAVKDGGGAGSKRSIQSSGPAGHAEDDIILEKQELSLLCPLSLVRMRVPVRGDCCEHIQCFDQDAWHSFVSKQNSNRPPHCPICKKPVTTTSEDPRFARLLELVPKETSKVWVDEEWQPVIEEDDQVSKKARYEDLQNDSDSDVIVLD